MTEERMEGKERKEYGKATENIGKDTHDEELKSSGKIDKEYGKAEEKVGKEREKREDR